MPINRSAWTPASRRSTGHYDDAATEYEGIRCQCRACEQSFVLSAAEQQYAYEVEQRFVRWLPALCPPCAARLVVLRERDRAYQQQWHAARQALVNDRRFISDWIAMLDEMAALGKPNSMRIHLQRLL